MSLRRGTTGSSPGSDDEGPYEAAAAYAGEGDPALLHVIGGPNAAVRPAAVQQGDGMLAYSWALTLAPGETKIIMHFASQNEDGDAALAKAPRLRRLELGALAGMSEAEAHQVVNFAVGNPRDHYSRRFTAGERVTVRTYTPAVGAPNPLNPRLEVRDAAGALVARDYDAAADRRNAVLSFTAPRTGTYTIAVIASGDTAGEYVLEIETTGAEL